VTVPLSGYTTKALLRASARARVYEAVRNRDQKSVVAKVFELGDEGVEARVEHEFHLLEQLDVEGVVRALGIERAGNQMVLLLDYVAGSSLAEYAAGRPLALGVLMPMALRLAETLGRVHERRVVHRDIKPSNILVEAGSNQVYLADFGISVLLESERAHIYDPDVLAGTLPYISPEQTGRTKREVDFRSDLYSLGATFYELLTGRRPFEATEPMELIHAHLARVPIPPRDLVPSVPAQLSAIVMKLLEKAPEHRYQSARGLQADLERFADALAHDEPEPNFKLGELDHPTSLQLPHQLYGRTIERATLQREFELVNKARKRRLLLLGGAPGLGKSALLRTLDAPVSASNGHFAYGRFEVGQHELPYRGFVGAFTSLVEQLLTLSDEGLKRWRRRLMRALGSIAGVVVTMVPELAVVLGELPPVPTLELGESRNRLQLALARFVAAFAQDAPLVLVLDDLQWADSGSLELLRALVSDGGEQPILFVGAYRSDEIHPGHALHGLIDALEREGRGVAQLELQPMSSEDLERMLSDVLGREHAEVAGLAEVISRKTGNNPLFVRQFLLHIEALGLLCPSRDGWRWDVATIAAAQIPDDVLGVMQVKLDRLAETPRELLALAACIGSRFDGATLEQLGNRNRTAVVAALYELEQQGLIGAVGSEWNFCHNRIQEAARERIDPEARRSLHWDIGELLLVRYGDDAFAEHVFEVVDQLDAALPLDSMPDERRRLLVRLNLAAGQRALESAAWTSARTYFGLAVELLAPEIELADAGTLAEAVFAACFGHAQTLELLGRTEQADLAFARLLGWPLSLVERAQVLARRIRILELQKRNKAALDLSIAALAEFGVRVRDKPSTVHVILAVTKAMRSLRSATRDKLLAMPAVADEREAAVLHLLAAAYAPAWLSSQELWVILLSLHVQRVMRAGYHPTAPIAFGSMAIVCMTMGQAKRALGLVELAVELAVSRVSTPAAAVSARSNLLTMVGPQCRPFREAAAPMEDAHREAIEVGERYIAGLIGSIGLVNHVEAGTHLREVLDIEARLRATDESYGAPEFAVIAEFMRRFIHVLIGSEGASFMKLAEVEVEISPLTRYALIAAEVWGRVILGEVDEPWALAKPLLGDYERVFLGSMVVPRFTMLAAILAARRYPMADAREQRELLAGVRKRYKTSKRWANIGPTNFQPMADIVGGLLASLRGDNELALRRFEAARAAALESGAHYVAGLASTCLADWAAREHLAATEAGARQTAREAFERMGARAIVEQLDHRHGSLTAAAWPPLERSSATPSASFRNSLTSDPKLLSLDMATVLGTMQAIGEDLQLEQVITRVLASAIENAGADRGVLLLERNGELALVAEGRGPELSATRTDSQLAMDVRFIANPVPLREARERLPTAVVLYVVRTGGSVVIDDISTDSRFSGDSYVGRSGVRSLLCMPIVKQSARIGALLLENRLSAGAFTPERLEVLRILLAQAASALDNARLYAALARSEAKWRSLVDGVPDIIALMDDHGQIEFVNHLAPYGNDASQMIGTPADQYMDPASRVAWHEALEQVVASGKPRELEICVAPPSQPRRWYNTRLAPVEAGPNTKYLSISTDISGRKQLEAQVRQQQRLESIGTLASGVAHEINNPVQGILNYAELIHASADDPKTVREFADEITRESDRVAVIVRGLLAFSRQERDQQREKIQVDKLIESTLSLIRSVMRKDNVRLFINVPSSLPPLSCRPQQIQQIILNLVTNARDALNSRYPGHHEHKLLEVHAETFIRDDTPWLRLTIADRGTGIPEDVRARIFDPFFTTKGRDQGTGLGLAVSHGIAVEHGGELRVESELGVGSRFHLELPLQGV
jgi:PAS domain S-box-containing protein